MSEERLKHLAERMAAHVNGTRATNPKLRLITTANLPVRRALLDGISREAHLRRIRLLSRSCDLYWMVDQATFHVANIDCLEDVVLVKLLRDMERARETGAEGLPLTEFVRSQCDDDQPPMFRRA